MSTACYSPTKVELTVDLLIIDDVEPVLGTSFHVADLKVEPLVVMVRVDVWVQDQVILILPHLYRTNVSVNPLPPRVHASH